MIIPISLGSCYAIFIYMVQNYKKNGKIPILSEFFHLLLPIFYFLYTFYLSPMDYASHGERQTIMN